MRHIVPRGVWRGTDGLGIVPRCPVTCRQRFTRCARPCQRYRLAQRLDKRYAMRVQTVPHGSN